MAYDIYKKLLTPEEYFENWSKQQVDNLTEELKERIYNKYLVKREVFVRDSFRCQNIDCRNESPNLTMHHVKFQKNGGEDKVINCITLCKSCHKNFHRALSSLTFADEEYLPKKMRGQTFKLHESDEIDWKKVKAEMKKMRKNLVMSHGIHISWEQLSILLRWLEIDMDYDCE